MITDDNITPTDNAMDKAFRFIADQWPRQLHENLNLPGKFRELLQNDVASDPKTNIRMDILELVDPNDHLDKTILINIEHQSKRLDESKIKKIDEYKEYSKCKYKYPLLSVVVSPYPKEEHKMEYCSTKSDILRPIFVSFDKDEINKKLNILKNNIKNKNLKNGVILDIALISIFVMHDIYEVLKQLCNILKDIYIENDKFRRDLVLVVDEMIKYKLKDDENKVKELLEMNRKEMEDMKRGVRIWFEEEFEKLYVQHQNELSIKDAEHRRAEANLKKELAIKDSKIADKDSKIAELEAIIKINGFK